MKSKKNKDKKKKRGYRTHVPEDLLDAAVKSVEKREKEATGKAVGEVDNAESPLEQLDETSDDPGIEIIVEEEVETATKPETSESPAPEEETDSETQDLSVEDLIASGHIPQKIVEALHSEQEKVRTEHQRMLRALAETENTRKRLIKQKDEAVHYASEQLLQNLLPALDNLELCMAHTKTDAARLKEGVEVTLRQFQHVMSKVGAKKVKTQPGDDFNPTIHEAVMQDNESSMPANKISKVIQSGYYYHERLLRPAMVTVSTGAGATDSEEDSGQEILQGTTIEDSINATAEIESDDREETEITPPLADEPLPEEPSDSTQEAPNGEEDQENPLQEAVGEETAAPDDGEETGDFQKDLDDETKSVV